MKRTLAALAVMVGVLFATMGTAAAQDQTITIEPAVVSEAGEHEFTVTAAGFNPTPGFLLPCPGAEGSLETIAEGDPATLCDLSNLHAYTVEDDGGWTATVSYEIPEEGLVLAAGDTGGDNAAAALISIGSDDAAADDDEAAADDSEEAAGDDGNDDDATTTSSGNLAETGTESALLVIIGATMVLAGLMMYRSGRVFSRL